MHQSCEIETLAVLSRIMLGITRDAKKKTCIFITKTAENKMGEWSDFVMNVNDIHHKIWALRSKSCVMFPEIIEEVYRLAKNINFVMNVNDIHHKKPGPIKLAKLWEYQLSQDWLKSNIKINQGMPKKNAFSSQKQRKKNWVNGQILWWMSLTFITKSELWDQIPVYFFRKSLRRCTGWPKTSILWWMSLTFITKTRSDQVGQIVGTSPLTID